jgi:hypothetical protein
MKKLVLTATFMLASFGAFAANGEIKSNNTIVPVKNNVEVVNTSNKTLKVKEICTVSIDFGVIGFSYSWDC